MRLIDIRAYITKKRLFIASKRFKRVLKKFNNKGVKTEKIVLTKFPLNSKNLVRVDVKLEFVGDEEKMFKLLYVLEKGRNWSNDLFNFRNYGQW